MRVCEQTHQHTNAYIQICTCTQQSQPPVQIRAHAHLRYAIVALILDTFGMLYFLCIYTYIYVYVCIYVCILLGYFLCIIHRNRCRNVLLFLQNHSCDHLVLQFGCCILIFFLMFSNTNLTAYFRTSKFAERCWTLQPINQ